jgi:hypothetical protein
LAGDLTGKDIGLALSKILGKYSGTSRIRWYNIKLCLFQNHLYIYQITFLLFH